MPRKSILTREKRRTQGPRLEEGRLGVLRLEGIERAASRLPLFALLALLPLCGCFGGPEKIADAPDADSLWEQAEVARVSGRHDEAATLYATFHRYHHRDERAAEALLDAGTEYRRAGSIRQARDHLVTAIQRGDARITPHACMQLGYLERAEGNYAAAAMRFGEAARVATDVETRADALLEQGHSLQRAGAFAEARRPLTACAELADIAPRHAKEARDALRQPPYFTVQVGAFQERKHADALALRISAAKISARVLEDASGAVPLYRVISGEFPRRPEAKARATKLESLGFDALIKP